MDPHTPSPNGDPFDDLLARVASEEVPGAGDEPMGDLSGSEDEQPAQQPVPNTPSHITGTATSSFVDFAVLREYGRQLKVKRTLSPEAQAELDVFTKSTTGAPAPQLVLIFWMLLLIWDLLRKQVKTELWEIPADLKDNIQVYTQAFIISPSVSAYRGRAADVILEAMRELNVRGIPRETEPAQVAMVLSAIGECLTKQRNLLKTKLRDTLHEGCEYRNVADLAAVVIGTQRLQASVSFYMRLAFLRFHLAKYPEKDGDVYWKHIDDALQKVATHDSSTNLRAFQRIYHDDIKTYGDPATSEYQVTPVADLPEMQKAINERASGVKPAARRHVAKRKKTTQVPA